MTRLFSFVLSGTVFLFILFLFGALFVQAVPALPREGWGLFTVAHWNFRQEIFGAAAMFYGTTIVAGLSIVFAFPIGLSSAIFVSEYLVGKPRAVAKMMIELLAGVPSVVYGLLGVVYLRNWLQDPITSLGGSSGDSLFTAGILLALMILPTMMTFADDALRCVPRVVREAARGMGLSKRKTICYVVLVQARSGIFGATMLALGRAIGETIAVYLVIGRADRPLPSSLFSLEAWIEGGQTITTKLGGAETAIAYGDSRHWSALMCLGVILWVIIGLMNHISESLFSKGRKQSA